MVGESSAPSMASRSARSGSERESPLISAVGMAGWVPGKRAGMETPAERKKRAGEAKGSKHEEGWAKRSCFSGWRSGRVKGVEEEMWSSSPVARGDGVEMSLVVAMEVQLNIPFTTMRPWMLTEESLEERDSVSAREVARVPPR